MTTAGSVPTRLPFFYGWVVVAAAAVNGARKPPPPSR